MSTIGKIVRCFFELNVICYAKLKRARFQVGLRDFLRIVDNSLNLLDTHVKILVLYAICQCQYVIIILLT